jgi:hypothetical protein
MHGAWGCQKGLGVFVAPGQGFKEKDVVSIYFGRAVLASAGASDREEVETVDRAYYIDTDTGPDSQRKRSVQVDAMYAEESRVARLVNHSCEPNCTFERMLLETQEGGNNILTYVVAVIASRRIKACEEVTVNYGRKGSQCVCHCGKKPGIHFY